MNQAGRQDRSANQIGNKKGQPLKFAWLVQGWSTQPFEVLRFQGTEALSQPYQFTVTLTCSDQSLDLSRLLSASCCLRIYSEQGDPQNFHGMLREVRIVSSTQQQLYLQVILVPRLWALSLGSQAAVFLDQSLPEILNAILTDQQQHGVHPAFTLKLMEKYSKKEFICQYNESSLQFISRLMEEAGLYYYFEQQEQRELLVITDHQNSHQLKPKTQPLSYYASPAASTAEQEQLISQWQAIISHLPGKVLFKGYNPEQPSQVVISKDKVEHPAVFSRLYQTLKGGEQPEGLGMYYHYGANFVDHSEGDRLVRNTTQRLQHQANYYQGKSQVPWLQAGHLFSLLNHPIASLNQSYLVTQVIHQGDQSADLLPTAPLSKDTLHYSNSLTAISAAYQYRPTCETPKPHADLLLGTIDASGSGQQAMLDKQGRYKVIFPFDLSGRGSGKASHWLRLAQPYGGKDGGMHFPLCKGTEVIIAFVNGDPDRPIIQATLPNLDNPSVVTEKNAAVNKLTTPSGNELTLEDTAGHRMIRLHNGGGTITLGDITLD